MYRLAYDEPTGHELARALNAKPAGSNCWTAKCPSHSDRRPSFSIGVSRDGRALFHCFAGCTQDQVLSALRSRGLWPQLHGLPRLQHRPLQIRQTREDDREVLRRRDVARWLWLQSLDGRGTPAETYLRSRGLHLKQWPATIRFLPATLPKHPWPALIAAYGIPSEPEPGVLAMAAADVVGVQLTCLAHDGRGKALIETQKRSIGGGHSAPMVIAAPNDLGGLAIAEGLEDAASLHVALGVGVWAAGAANRLPKMADLVPDHVEVVTVAVDGDAAGRRWAYELVRRLEDRGIETIPFGPWIEGRRVA